MLNKVFAGTADLFPLTVLLKRIHFYHPSAILAHNRFTVFNLLSHDSKIVCRGFGTCSPWRTFTAFRWIIWSADRRLLLPPLHFYAKIKLPILTKEVSVMGFFDKLRGKPEAPAAPDAAWENAFEASIKFCTKEGAPTLGVLTLTETVETILPKDPTGARAVNGQAADEWRLVLVSITKNTIIGMPPYAQAMERLKPYIQDERGGLVLTRGLTLAQLETLLAE